MRIHKRRSQGILDERTQFSLDEIDSQSLRTWQTFLARVGEFKEPIDGRNSSELANATKRFQASRGKNVTGDLDLDTVEEALADPMWPGVSVGPARPKDVISSRPYFLVPLLETAFPLQQRILAKQILAASKEGRAVSDIFVISHGWHRSYLSGVAAYDRLISRFMHLVKRGRIETPPNFNPIFVGLHWHSDPGKDSWVDESGRRDKSSFMVLARTLFRPIGAEKNAAEQLENDFEDMFEKMARHCAPDAGAFAGRIPTRNENLAPNLERYCFAFSSDKAETFEAKVSMLWRCYFEAEEKSFLVDQTEKPSPTGSPRHAVGTLFKFIIGNLGLLAALRLVLGLLPSGQLNLTQEWNSVSKTFEGWFTNWKHPQQLVSWASVQRFGLIGLEVILASIAILCILGEIRRTDTERSRRLQPSKGVPIVQLLAWLPMQVVFTVPILVNLLFTYLFRSAWSMLSIPIFLAGYPAVSIVFLAAMAAIGSLSARLDISLSGVFSEKLRNEGDHALHLRDILAQFARFPIMLVANSVGPESEVRRLADAIDDQLAFFGMQRKGTEAGVEAGWFVRELAKEGVIAPDQASPRVHLVGHSFGGLVVANMARTLSNPPEPMPSVRVDTLCLLEAAIASDWFKREQGLVKAIRGSLANVFSGYDTANGFYYPFANNGRLAAGFLGICNVGSRPYNVPDYLGKGGIFSMIVEPMDLVKYLPEKPKSQPPPYILNLDGSRIIYDGPVASGGGHDDIFKDDVVNLLWSAMSLSMPGSRSDISTTDGTRAS